MKLKCINDKIDNLDKEIEKEDLINKLNEGRFMVNKLDGSSFDIVKNNIQKLKELFPEVVDGDNEIDFDNLRDIFKKYDENIVDDGEEHYKFTWWGKKEAKNNAKATTTKTLRPVKKDSKNWDTTNNIYIEGDNLDALKILLGSYRNKIKMIYIDPPYNTGNDFIYVDNYRETNKEHLKRTGQLNADGFLDENPVTDGKYHSKWLNMIYPRLYLAKKLLTHDGAIFISIGEEEIANLKKICDEIFGESNFVANLTWHKKTQPSFLSKEVASVKENILFYKNSSDKIITKGGFSDSNKLIEMINISNNVQIRELNKENVILKNMNYSGELKKGIYGTGNLVIELLNDINIKNGRSDVDLQLKGRFKWSQEKMDESFKEGDIYYIKNLDSLRPTVERKNKVVNVKPTLDLLSKKLNDNIPTNTDATNELKKLFDDISPMDYPKPSNLIKYLIDCITYDDKEAIILDFFSGSATTAHALMKLNLEDGGNRKYILVQIPEETNGKSDAYKLGYKTICEMAEERIKRSGDKILEESENKDLDIGFKVFRVDDSNFIPWNPNIDSDNIEHAILSTRDNLVTGRSELDLIYELLLKLNLDLNASIEEVTLDNSLKNKVYVIRNGFMLVCLDEELSDSIADDLLNLKKELKSTYTQVVLKDSALNDSASINIYELLKSNNVRFYTI